MGQGFLSLPNKLAGPFKISKSLPANRQPRTRFPILVPQIYSAAHNFRQAACIFCSMFQTFRKRRCNLQRDFKFLKRALQIDNGVLKLLKGRCKFALRF